MAAESATQTTRTGTANPQPTQQLSAMGEQYNWSAIAIHPFAAVGVVLGLVGAVVGRLLATMWQTQGSPGPELAQLSIWLDWAGLTLIAVSLMLGGLVSKTTSAGIRVAMVAVGLYVLLQSTQVPIQTFTIPGLF